MNPNCLTAPGRNLVAILILAAASFCLPASAQQGTEITITPNYKEADIRQIVEAVGEISDRTFIIDPRVQNQKVTMLSSTPMTPDAFYEAFLSILDVHGLAAVTQGGITKIIPNATARQFAGPLGSSNAAGRTISSPRSCRCETSTLRSSYRSSARWCRSTAISLRIQARTC